MFRAKNGESLEKSNTQHSSKDTSAIQTPTGTIGDCHIYPTNSVASNVTAGTPMSPPALKRNGSVNSGGTAADITQHQSVWPTAITTTDHHDDCNTHKNEGESVSITTVLEKMFLKTILPSFFLEHPVQKIYRYDYN